MADPTTTNDLTQYGPAGGLLAVVISAFAAALKFNTRITEAEAKAKAADERAEKAEKAVSELEDRLRAVEKGPNADAVKALIVTTMQPYQEKAIELREKLAEINGTLRSITGSDDRRPH